MKLILNRDYTLEGDYQVMSREFLLARGYCCQSGCRNCPYKQKLFQNDSPKIVSLVPSWTETLMAAGANVVGCTRFCIHPKELTQNCVKVGGTKAFDTEKLLQLNPDFVLMDKEENTKEMFESCPFPVITTHIHSLIDLKMEMELLAKTLNLPTLRSYAQRLEILLKKSKNKHDLTADFIPGIVDWWKKPTQNIKNYTIIYVIWKNPYMCITKNTFIGSILEALGFGAQQWALLQDGKYLEFDFKEIPENSLLLFSTEPFPFKTFKDEYLKSQWPYPAALIDGESYSWFGLRSLRFLEEQMTT